MKVFITSFWNAVASQNAEKLGAFFNEGALIRWYNTNEEFSIQDFITATCKYPDQWVCTVKSMIECENQIITVTNVLNLTKNISLYATSFFTLKHSKISLLEEYWGDNGEAPQWRLDLGIGSKIL